MIGLALLMVLAPPADVAWPPPTPTASLPSGISVGATLRPAGVEPATGMCARETHETAYPTCRITRFDAGPTGFDIVGGSKVRCEVVAEPTPEQEHRYVFDAVGNLREDIAIDKKTSIASGNMYRWENDRLTRIEYWADFKSKQPALTESFRYDDKGQVLEFTREEPPDTASRYLHTWHDGQVLTTTQVGTGTLWSYAYEGTRLAAVTERPAQAGPSETRYSYGKKGNLDSEEFRRGDQRVRWTGFSYDKEHRLVSKAVDDKGPATAPGGANFKNADGSAAVLSTPRPDGAWDRVTRYYYDCSWIADGDGDSDEKPPPVDPGTDK